VHLRSNIADQSEQLDGRVVRVGERRIYRWPPVPGECQRLHSRAEWGFAPQRPLPRREPAIVAEWNAAPSLGLTVQEFDVRSVDELDAAFDAMVRAGMQPIVVKLRVCFIKRRKGLPSSHWHAGS
jgi:hypothetical protein